MCQEREESLESGDTVKTHTTLESRGEDLSKDSSFQSLVGVDAISKVYECIILALLSNASSGGPVKCFGTGFILVISGSHTRRIGGGI